MRRRTASTAGHSRRRLGPAGFFAALVLATPTAHGARYYAATRDGNWFAPTSWSPAGVPSSFADEANIDRVNVAWTPYTVTLDSPATAFAVWVNSPLATLAIGSPNSSPVTLTTHQLGVGGGLFSVRGAAHLPISAFFSSGAVNVRPGAVLRIGSEGASARFVHNTAGALNLEGPLRLEHATFEHRGGAIVGPAAISLYHSRLVHYAPGPGAAPDGTFIFRTNGLVAPGGNYPAIPAGRVVVAQANGESPAGHSVTLKLEPSLFDAVNDGRLVLESVDGDYDVTLDAKLVNRSTFLVRPGLTGGGLRAILGTFKNDPGATATFDASATLHDLVTNRGSIVIAPGRTVTVKRPSGANGGVVQASGTLDVQGDLRMEAPFTYEGGSITGRPIGIYSWLTFAGATSAAGSGTFAVRRGGNLYGTIPTGASVILQSNDEVAFSRNIRMYVVPSSGNFGSLRVEVTAEGHHANLHVGPQPAGTPRFTNHGTFTTVDVSAAPASTPVLHVLGEMTNARSGRIAFEGSTDLSNTLFNDGVVSVSAPTRFEADVINTGTFTVSGEASAVVRGRFDNSGSVRLEPGARLDLANSLLHRATDAAARDAAIAAYTALIRSARNAPMGLWKGAGIAAADQSSALTGLAIAATSDSEMTIKLTYNGDANLDGTITSDDYFRIDSGFLAQPQDPTYAQGDFNYDGTITSDDYFLIDSAFLGQGAPLARNGDSSPLMSAAVPEPSIALLASLGALSIMRRQRRR